MLLKSPNLEFLTKRQIEKSQFLLDTDYIRNSLPWKPGPFDIPSPSHQSLPKSRRNFQQSQFVPQPQKGLQPQRTQRLQFRSPDLHLLDDK
mgnify:CR=1 FL=1